MKLSKSNDLRLPGSSREKPVFDALVFEPDALLLEPEPDGLVPEPDGLVPEPDLSLIHISEPTRPY